MTKNICLVSIAMSLLMFATVGQAQQIYSILGWGNMKCSEYKNDNPNLNTNLMMAWMLGYVTAHNRLKGDVTEDTNMRTPVLVEWVDRYCKEHSDHVLADASAALIMHLSGR